MHILFLADIPINRHTYQQVVQELNVQELNVKVLKLCVSCMCTFVCSLSSTVEDGSDGECMHLLTHYLTNVDDVPCQALPQRPIP